MEAGRKELQIQSLESCVESWLHQELGDLESHLSHRIPPLPLCCRRSWARGSLSPSFMLVSRFALSQKFFPGQVVGEGKERQIFSGRPVSPPVFWVS